MRQICDLHSLSLTRSLGCKRCEEDGKKVRGGVYFWSEPSNVIDEGLVKRNGQHVRLNQLPGENRCTRRAVRDRNETEPKRSHIKMNRLLTITLACCIMSAAFAQLPMGMGPMGGGLGALLPLMMRGGGGEAGMMSMLMMSMLGQGGAAGGAGGASSLMPLLMMMRGGGTSEMMLPLMMMMNQGGGANGMMSNPLMMMMLSGGGDAMAKYLPLMMMQQGAGAGAGAAAGGEAPSSGMGGMGAMGMPLMLSSMAA
ncbi:glycine and methionine-rich protein [Biomphalaria pfeifferi]|uniref:Glycine and methionine-rich protein n=1 Tax=Biomphalaria pfeifferi TaxID=112525 RepID=A0AAD8BMJ1_BIOPF|nr:glycine and methionine-rich protein [Biomphalaria pfeifferi]